MTSLTERCLRLGQMKLAQILCGLEEYLARVNGEENAEKFVDKIEHDIIMTMKR